MDISHDGKFLITGDKSGAIKIWDIPNKILHH